MSKEEKIEILKKFHAQMKIWNDLKAKGHQFEKESEEALQELAGLWGDVSEILKGLDYNLEIEVTDHNRSKSIKPKLGDIFHDGIYSESYNSPRYTNISKLQSYVLSAMSKVQRGAISKDNILPSFTVLLNILNSFSDVVSKLKYRRSGKHSLDIKDEYDVQDILYAMLKGMFPSLQYEDPGKKVGPSSSRADFTVADIGVFIETKYISEKGKEKIIHDECLADIQKYGKQAECQKIVFFVYDPQKCIDNQYAFKSGLGNNHVIDGKNIEVITLIFN